MSMFQQPSIETRPAKEVDGLLCDVDQLTLSMMWLQFMQSSESAHPHASTLWATLS